MSEITISTGHPDAGRVYAEALDRVTAERDALQHRLTAADEELDQCQSMALMIEEKEWAEHVGKGPISSRVESAFTQLHNELYEARQAMTAADERVDVLETALAGMLFAFDDGVGREWSEDLLDFARKLTAAKEFKAALKPEESPLNQCDGCQAGIPVVSGAHRMGKPGGYPDTMSCTAKLYVEERPDGCCCPPKGHAGLWAAAMCPVHQGLRALKR